MPKRKDGFDQHEYYHVFNRGVNKNNIFFSDDHYLLCLRKVSKYAARYNISVVAYCLMPNHYHFLLRQDGETDISKFVGVVFDAYVQKVNHELGRTGSLFQGRFRHVHVDDLAYLIGVCSYIHLNPVKAGLVKQPEDWIYSNYQEWIGKRNGKLVDRELVKEYFSNPGGDVDYINGYIDDQLPGRYYWD